MSIAHPGDEEADQAEPLLRDPDAYSLNSFNESNENDVESSALVREKRRRYGQHRINAVFPNVQKYPLKLFDAYASSTKRKGAILALACGLWVAYIVFLCVRAASVPAIAGYGEPRRLTCYSNAFVGHGRDDNMEYRNQS